MEFSSMTTAQAVILFVIICLVIAGLKKARRRHRRNILNGARLPPGPSSLPFLGNVATLLNGLSPQRALAWSRIYGPVIRVMAGTTETIVLNDLSVIWRFLNHKDLLYRSRSWILSDTVDL
ncbi:hypothetical protein MTO96_037786, partial [Rhipicephalus appendiculatus]